MSNTIPELIAAHRAAWEAFQVAPDGDVGLDAEDDEQEALHALCCTPVASHEDVNAMLDHLTWYTLEEGGQVADLPRALLAALYWAQSRGTALLLECR
jgi:hypothetical protein